MRCLPSWHSSLIASLVSPQMCCSERHKGHRVAEGLRPCFLTQRTHQVVKHSEWNTCSQLSCLPQSPRRKGSMQIVQTSSSVCISTSLISSIGISIPRLFFGLTVILGRYSYPHPLTEICRDEHKRHGNCTNCTICKGHSENGLVHCKETAWRSFWLQKCSRENNSAKARTQSLYHTTLLSH